MEPLVALTWSETPEEPWAPEPTSVGKDYPRSPTGRRWRCSELLEVVGSTGLLGRYSTSIGWSGRSTPSLSAAMASSFQLRMSPLKILAMVSTDRFRSSTPSRLKATATGPMTSGRCAGVVALATVGGLGGLLLVQRRVGAGEIGLVREELGLTGAGTAGVDRTRGTGHGGGAGDTELLDGLLLGAGAFAG